jgi:hypothetical protein
MKKIRWIAIGFTIFILFLVLLADMGQAQIWFGALYAFPYGDAVAHSLLMGTLSFLLNLAFPSQRHKPLRVRKTSLILAAFITLEECSQILIPGRTFSLIDLAGDYLGVFLLGEFGVVARNFLFHPSVKKSGA